MPSPTLSSQQSPTGNLRHLLETARQLLESQRPVEAAHAFRSVLAMEPNCVEALVPLGQLFFQFNELPAALGCLQHAAKLSPDTPGLNTLLAAVLRKMGRLEESALYCEQGIHVSPEDADAHYNMALVPQNLESPPAQREGVSFGEPLQKSASADEGLESHPSTSHIIPQLIHRVWFGPAAIPAEDERYWEAWQRQFPQYEFRTWRDADIESLSAVSAKIKEAQGGARKADIARYEILNQMGGIYLDCDMMPYHPFDFAHSGASLIVCNEVDTDDYCSIGFMAAAPGHEVFRWATRELSRRPLNQSAPCRETGPWLFRQALNQGPHQKLPTAAFYPHHYNEPAAAVYHRDLSGTYGVHQWAASWMHPNARLEKAAQRAQQGDLAEAAYHLQGDSSPQGRPIQEFCRFTRAAREAALAAAKTPVMAQLLKLSDTAPFQFLKASFFLANGEPKPVVWQIGAADGMLVDPLRPLLVNYDLPAVLLEPNPYLFESLTLNYGRNRNAILLNAAFGHTAGTLSLNAVNPAKVKEQGLPDWVRGLSSAFRDRNALGGHTTDPATARLINTCVETITAKMVSVADLLQASGNRPPDIVAVDTEGMDFAVVDAIVRAGIKPRLLHFETQCLPPSEREQLNRLLAADYVVVPFGNDAVAYRRDFLFAYCEGLYIEHGIPTIFGSALRSTMQL